MSSTALSYQHSGGGVMLPAVRARWVAVAVVAAAARPAAADDNDLVLSRLATKLTDASGNITIIPDQLAFRALASQLGVVLAPQLLAPADTIGFGGFELAVDTTSTGIDATAPYWRVLESSPDPTGASGKANGGSTMNTVGVFVRKGLWLPVPSFEVGVGAVHLDRSSSWAGQLYTKLGVAEGYHGLPLPSVAVRGAVSRLMTQRELDLTVASVDVTVSKHVGIGGTWRLDPYLGWNYLWIIPRSGVLDPVPNLDSLAPGQASAAALDFVFPGQADITRTRLFAGAKAQYGHFALTAEVLYTLAGTSVDQVAGATGDCTSPATTTKCNTPDTAAAQLTLAAAATVAF
jgi:hypothetical protein